MSRPGLVVLISGRGSNMHAIADAIDLGALHGEIRAVISNKPDAPGLEAANAAGIPTEILSHRAFATRDAFDTALAEVIDRYSPKLVVLAGFMRVLTDAFIHHYDARLINIHPSLLPAFPGLNTHQRALDAGAKEHGTTVHFVTPEVDAGPIIAQARVPVLAGDTPETLAARVLREEHRIYPMAIEWFLEGRLSVRDGRVLLDGVESPEQGLSRASRD
jgi:phosphoribosylglycinamide formyltransferase-1